MKAQKLNRRQARWTLYLSRFDFVLKYILESKMRKADSLSRRPDQEVGVERDNENKTLVKLEWLEVQRTEGVEVIIEKVDLLEKVKQSRVKDNEVIKAVKEMKQAGVKMLIYKEEKVYVSKDNILRMEIIRLYHNTLVERYRGQ